MTTRATVAPRLLPAPDAAHYLGVSLTTLSNLAIPRSGGAPTSARGGVPVQ